MLTPQSAKGIGDPEDLTGAVILLCSEAGRFITGTDIKIDGSLLWRVVVKCGTDSVLGGYTMF